MSATEFMAQMDRRMAEDPDYQRRVEAAERERAERARFAEEAEKPILADLAAAGVKVGSVWDLYRFPELRVMAIPVLLEHLTRDYPDRVVVGIGQALDDKAVRPWWSQLKALYLETDDPEVRDCLAAVLSDVATRVHYEDLLKFVRDVRLGETRIYFLRPINRIGNRMAPGVGRAVIELLADDPMLGKEATAILIGRGRNG